MDTSLSEVIVKKFKYTSSKQVNISAQWRVMRTQSLALHKMVISFSQDQMTKVSSFGIHKNGMLSI